MSRKRIGWVIAALFMALFFIGQAKAQTKLYWQDGTIIGSTAPYDAGKYEALSRDLTAYNRARGAVPIVSATVADGLVAVERAATLEVGAGSGLGKVAKVAVRDIVKSPVSSVGKGVLTLARANPVGIIGTIAGNMLLDAGISYIGGQWAKTGNPEKAPNGPPYSSTGGFARYAKFDGSGQVEGAEDFVCGVAVADQAAYFQRAYSYTGMGAIAGSTRICNVTWQRDTGPTSLQISVQRQASGCATGHTLSNGMCMPPGYVPGSESAPATDAQISDAISSGITTKTGLVPDLVRELEAKGGWVHVEPSDGGSWVLPSPTVQGAASQSVSKSRGPDGKELTTTSTTTPTMTVTQGGGSSVTNNHITYNVTNVTTTVITDEAGNVVGGSQQSEDIDTSFVDSAMPGIPKLYEQKYPDGIAGVWRDNKPDVQSTAFYRGVASMFPSFGGGQCPVWRMSFNLGAAGNFGSGDLTVPCWIFQAMGLVMLATAAFTARKILF